MLKFRCERSALGTTQIFTDLVCQVNTGAKISIGDAAAVGSDENELTKREKRGTLVRACAHHLAR